MANLFVSPRNTDEPRPRRAADAAGAVAVTEVFKAIGLQQAMLVIPGLCVLLAIVLLCGSRTIVGDIVKREAHHAYARL